MKINEMLKLNNKTITEEQFKNIKDTCYVSHLIKEKENYITNNGKKLFYDGYVPCRIIFDDNSYIHVFINK